MLRKSESSNSQLEAMKKEPLWALFSWLGMRDSNPRMSAPKADALPLGESPV